MNHIKVYSDLSFLLPILSNIEEIPYIKGAMYFKRIRPMFTKILLYHNYLMKKRSENFKPLL